MGEFGVGLLRSGQGLLSAARSRWPLCLDSVGGQWSPNSEEAQVPTPSSARDLKQCSQSVTMRSINLL